MNNLKSNFLFFVLLPKDCLVALIGSIVCISFTPIFLRLSETEIGFHATVFNRFWIAAVTLWIVSQSSVLKPREQDSKTPKFKPNFMQIGSLLILDGVLMSMGLICWAWSLTETSVANASMMHNLVPIFTILGGWLVLGHTFDRRFMIGMFIAILGALLLEVNNLFSFTIDRQLLGDFAALLSALFFGIHPLIVEQLRTRFNSLTIITWSSITGFLLLLPIVMFTEQQIFPSSLTGWFSVMALAFVGQIMGIGLWTYSLKKLSAGFAGIVALVIPFLSAVEGWAIFSENLNQWTWVSFFVIVCGMYLAISSTSAIKCEIKSVN
ncbi:MAG: DMT family transporter [Nostocaceae cyanobacterium]|nr:DMT family transporter [Nostocaceae cyanobacterium]